MDNLGIQKVCSECGESGHNCRSHKDVIPNRCSFCGRPGHKYPRCGRRLRSELEEQSDSVAKSKVLNPPQGFSMRRGSTASLSQEEIDMATRVVIGCSEEASNGEASPAVIERASRLTGLNRKSVLNITASLKQGDSPKAVESVRGQYLRAEPHRDLLTKINDTIDKLHATGTMTTSKKIAGALNFYHGIQIKTRYLTSILKEMGYTYTSPGPSNVILAKESECMRKNRLDYLRRVHQSRKERHLVYLDESYVNQRHNQKKCWLQKGSKVYIPSGKGARYILYGAGSRNGWVGKPTVFKNKDGKDDYHTAMNSKRFEELFEETCCVAEEQLGKCLFIMDNASYHKRLEDERYLMSYWTGRKAADVKEDWAKGEVPGQEGYEGEPPKYKKDIIKWLQKNKPEGVTKVSSIAEEHGHSVLLLPPYRPELNAIEIAWGVAKNFVASQNCPQFTFSGLQSVIEQGLQKVTVDTWIKIDKKVYEEEALQLHNLDVEEQRRQAFREEHPDLIFRLDSDTDTDSDEDDSPVDDQIDQDVLAAVADGLEDRVPSPELYPRGEEYTAAAACESMEVDDVSPSRNCTPNLVENGSDVAYDATAVEALLSLCNVSLFEE